MSKTIELANANGWDSEELGRKIDYAFAPLLNVIEDSQHTATKTAVESVCVALADCKESVPNATIEEVRDTVSERIKRSKQYSFVAKSIAQIALLLHAVGFTTAEAIDAQLTRQKWPKLAERCKALQSGYDLISRLYEAGLHCKLSEVREVFRLAFNSSKAAVEVKKVVAETMLGFTIAQRTFELYVTGQSVEIKLADESIVKKHIPSALERFETARSLDGVAQRAGMPQDTASLLKLNRETIKAENEVYLANEAAELKAKQDKAAAAAKQKAEDEAAQRLAITAQRQTDAKQKAEEIQQGEKLGEALLELAAETLEVTEAEAGKDVLQQNAAHETRKSEARNKRAQRSNKKGDKRIAA